MKLSDLATAAEIHERDLKNPVYRAEYDHTRLASDIAIRVIQYRTGPGGPDLHRHERADDAGFGLRAEQLADGAVTI